MGATKMELNERIEQIGLPIEVLNWRDIIIERASELLKEEMSRDVNLFPAMLVEKCIQRAQAEFCADKMAGRYDELNCEVE